jgi:hypothetical protein
LASFRREIETAHRGTPVERDHTLALVSQSLDLQSRICAYAHSNGLSHLRFIGAGSWSTVFESSDHRILRITPKTRPRPRHPAILQAYSERLIGEGPSRVKVEILPRLRTDNVTKEDCALIVDALTSSGFCTTDVFRRNIGKLPDGTPLLIDPDDEYAPKVIATFSPSLRAFKTPDGRTWKQYQAFPGLDPERSHE